MVPPPCACIFYTLLQTIRAVQSPALEHDAAAVSLHRNASLSQRIVDGRDLAVTVSFNFGKDPQRGTTYDVDNMDLMKDWYSSCVRLDMRCQVIYDRTFT